MRVIAFVLCLVAGLAVPPARADDGVDADDVEVTTGYRKGRPFRLRLAPVEWTYLDVRTARAYKAMQAAAAADGIELYLYSGFRSHERQIALYAAWKAGYGNRAARPGYSLHQSGRALDLYVRDPRTREWLAKHAARWGFKRTVGDEPWHYEHTPRPVRAARRKK